MLPSNRPQAWHRNPAPSLPRQRLVAAAGRHVTPTEPRARSLAARLGDSPIFPLFPFANGERVSRVVAGSSGRRAQGAGVFFFAPTPRGAESFGNRSEVERSLGHSGRQKSAVSLLRCMRRRRRRRCVHAELRRPGRSLAAGHRGEEAEGREGQGALHMVLPRSRADDSQD